MCCGESKVALAQRVHCLGNTDIRYRLHTVFQQQVREELLQGYVAARQVKAVHGRRGVFVDGVHVQVGVGLVGEGRQAELITENPGVVMTEVRGGGEAVVAGLHDDVPILDQHVLPEEEELADGPQQER